MRAQILKIAGVKSEKDFYKKFPTEEAFMKKHAKAFKKAQMGAYIGGEKTSNPQMMNFDDYYNAADKQITGTNNPERQQQAYQQQMIAAQQGGKQGGGGGLGDIMGMVSQGMEMFGGEGGAEGMAAMAARNGRNIPQAQVGLNTGKGYAQSLNTQWQRPEVTNISTQLGSHQFGIDKTMAGSGVPEAGKITQGEKEGFDFAGAAGAVGEIAGGLSALKEEKNKLKGLQQGVGVSALTLKASASRPEETQRRYTRPEDIQNTGEEFFPIYGVGTNALAKNGRNIPMAQNGFSNFMGKGGTNMATNFAGKAFGNNAGSQIGAGVGNALNFIPGVGKVIGAVAAPVLSAVGGALDQAFGPAGKIKKNQAKLDQNMQGIAANQFGQGVQQQYSSFVEDGGDIPSNMNPQVLSRFGDHSAEDIYNFAHQGMDTLRTGGNIRQNQMAMGGELQVYDGEAEQISTNPYLPDGGETVMFRGPSHEDGGMPISYGNSPVEVEGGEPALKLQNGGEEENLVIYGNLQIPKGMLQDPDAKNKKFKNYVNLLSKKEERQNKIADKSTKELSEFEPITSFDKLKLASFEANLKGTNMKLKDLAEKKIDAAALQNAINDTAEEQGLVADDLARGKYKVDKNAEKERMSRWGAAIKQANDGLTTTTEETTKLKKLTTKEAIAQGYTKVKGKDNEWIKPPDVKQIEKEEKSAEALKDKPLNQKSSTLGTYGKVTKEQFEQAKAENPWYNWIGFDPKNKEQVKNYQDAFNAKAKEIGSSAYIDPDTLFGEQTASGRIKINKKTEAVPSNTISVEDPTTTAEETTKSRFPWMQYANQALEYLRPTDQEALDPNQLYGEMYSMMNNQLEPVPAQGYRPQLDVPYDISLQDQLNEVTAQSREAMRMAGGNPAMAAMIAGQAYDPKSKILAEQFRMNQGKKDQVYSQNRATMNDAQLKNLAIYDQQYGRQAQAKANTKEATQLALNSMSDKFAKNKLENRQLGIYENLYKYRFDDKGRAMNMNPLVDFNERIANASQNPQMGMSDAEQELNLRDQADVLKAKRTEQKKREKETAISRNGSIVKALRNY